MFNRSVSTQVVRAVKEQLPPSLHLLNNLSDTAAVDACPTSYELEAREMEEVNSTTRIAAAKVIDGKTSSATQTAPVLPTPAPDFSLSPKAFLEPLPARFRVGTPPALGVGAGSRGCKPPADSGGGPSTRPAARPALRPSPAAPQTAAPRPSPLPAAAEQELPATVAHPLDVDPFRADWPHW